MVKRLVRSTRVPTAELSSPRSRSPSQCPGTARSARALVWAPLGDLGVCESGDVVACSFSKFNRGAPAQGAVASLPIVEDLQVLKDRIGELEASALSPAVEQLGLHAGPEGLDGGVVVGVTDGAHGGQQSGVLGALGERPRSVFGQYT